MANDFDPNDLQQSINDAFTAGAVDAVVQFNASDVVAGQANLAASDYARQRAALAVTMIDETTKNTIARIVADAFEDPEATMDSITEDIDSSGIFSEGRAATIARTEVARAQMQGTRSVWQALGVKQVEVLLSADNPCDECQDISDNGPYDLEDAVLDEYPFHPNCQCTLLVVE